MYKCVALLEKRGAEGVQRRRNLDRELPVMVSIG